jgi:hypothetical protein
MGKSSTSFVPGNPGGPGGKRPNRTRASRPQLLERALDVEDILYRAITRYRAILDGQSDGQSQSGKANVEGSVSASPRTLSREEAHSLAELCRAEDTAQERIRVLSRMPAPKAADAPKPVRRSGPAKAPGFAPWKQEPTAPPPPSPPTTETDPLAPPAG